MRLRSKVLVVAATLTTLLAARTAYAFWSTTGTGTGGGSVATVAGGTVVLSGTLSGALYPGATRTLAVTVANSGSSPVRIGPVSATVSVLDGTSQEINAVCQISVSPYNQNTDVAANQTATALADLTVTMVNDAATDQDPCQGATVSFALTSAAPI